LPSQPRKVDILAFLPVAETSPTTLDGLIEALEKLRRQPEMHFVRLVSEGVHGARQNLDIHTIQGKLQVQITVEKKRA
jgi:hypothetical protein